MPDRENARDPWRAYPCGPRRGPTWRTFARYTETTWGRRQTDLYLTAIDAALGALAVNPKIGKPRDALRAGYRSSRVGAHVIFYRDVPEGIEVVRILHQRMDVRRQLASGGDD